MSKAKLLRQIVVSITLFYLVYIPLHGSFGLTVGVNMGYSWGLDRHFKESHVRSDFITKNRLGMNYGFYGQINVTEHIAVQIDYRFHYGGDYYYSYDSNDPFMIYSFEFTTIGANVLWDFDRLSRVVTYVSCGAGVALGDWMGFRDTAYFFQVGTGLRIPLKTGVQARFSFIFNHFFASYSIDYFRYNKSADCISLTGGLEFKFGHR